ncbi:MAG: hypothetical protein NZ700_08050 [Gemmataceae bacterium]|nr:hypothetical protein [Gemmataceae bacterium]MDW8266511.1 hypothetical protein [Gemmataceae bacterium]
MATFYLLPPRSLVAQHLAEWLQRLYPGVSWDWEVRAELTDFLAAAAARRPDVFVVHREDLADGEATDRALADGFGASPGDEVIEVHLGLRPGEVSSHSWRLAG